ncbi:MAG: alpha-L-fucosidase [Fimbriimonas sp.]|nr:alpha-L-fucosidase [Fimbriimonas sp.]
MLSLAAAMLSLSSISVANPDANRMQWWTEARFGMFIHWDMSSIAGTEISWSRKGSKPLDIFGDPAGYVEDPMYDHLYTKFDPSSFNADAWAKLAKEAGMKYVVFTSKHHDGFSMFHTKFSDYGIANTPFKRDVLKELFQACRKEGLKVGIYYSPRDWHQPDYGAPDSSKYHAFLMGQLTELLTNYGKIDVMWFDSFGRGDSIKYWRADEMLELVRRLQPDIIVNNRGRFYGDDNTALQGDFDTPEQRLGEFQNTRPWETCMTIVKTPDGGGWSYRSDGTVRTYEECIRSLVSCACGDGNLLLDVGPDATGVIPADQSGRLLQVGAWIKAYGDTIYKTRGGPYRNGAWGGSTYRGKSVYLHVFGWPDGDLSLPPLKAKIVSVRTIRGGKPVFSQSASGVHILVAPSDRDPIDTVVEVKLDRSASEEMTDGHPLPGPG